LHASRDGLPKIYVKLSKEMTSIFINLKPEYAICVEEDGTLIVEVLKGLYGLIESVHTWYNHLTSFLKLQDFIVWEHDKCVMKKGEVTIAIYVDDLLITGPQEDVNRICVELEGQFGNCKRKTGSEFNFLGINSKVLNGRASLHIDLSKIVDKIEGRADTPAPNNLLAVSDQAEELNDINRQKFHSMVAKLLYIAKRSRPDIMFVVNFLCTRVLKPTVEDFLKLVGVLKYLRATMDYELILEEKEHGEDVVMEVYFDASYGVHQDAKSHSGMVVTLGSGTILAVSTKQKCVSKSSTEAELIAVTDLLPNAMELRNITEEITGKKVRLVFYQDNMATIRMIKNGTVGARSKHIKIRFAWLKEKLEAGDFELEYKPTG